MPIDGLLEMKKKDWLELGRDTYNQIFRKTAFDEGRLQQDQAEYQLPERVTITLIFAPTIYFSSVLFHELNRISLEIIRWA